MLKSDGLKLLCISILLLFSACGGGSSDAERDSSTKEITDSISSETPIPLTIHAGADRKAQINREIIISGYITGKGEISSYEWTKDGQVLATTLKFTYIPTQLGVDILKLTATDSQGNKLSDTIKIEVLQEYQESLLPF